MFFGNFVLWKRMFEARNSDPISTWSVFYISAKRSYRDQFPSLWSNRWREFKCTQHSHLSRELCGIEEEEEEVFWRSFTSIYRWTSFDRFNMLWPETVERKGTRQGWIRPAKILLSSSRWSVSVQWHLLLCLLWRFRKLKPDRILRLSQRLLFHANWCHAFNHWVEFTPSFWSNWWLRNCKTFSASYSIWIRFK